MKKTIIIIVSILVVIALVVGAVFLLNNKGEKSVLSMATSEDLENIINSIYEKANIELPMLMTNVVDVSDVEAVTFSTGLKSNENIEQVVVSEPMMTSQAYSLVLVKVKEGADVESIKKEMVDNIDTRKWICVTADTLYATNHSNLICLVMSREELTKPIYNAFKEVVNQKVGKELERITEN